MTPLSDIQVILPYQELVKLLEAAGAAVEYAKEVKRRDEQINAMRSQLVEVFDRIGEVQKELARMHW